MPRMRRRLSGMLTQVTTVSPGSCIARAFSAMAQASNRAASSTQSYFSRCTSFLATP